MPNYFLTSFPTFCIVHFLLLRILFLYNSYVCRISLIFLSFSLYIFLILFSFFSFSYGEDVRGAFL